MSIAHSPLTANNPRRVRDFRRLLRPTSHQLQQPPPRFSIPRASHRAPFFALVARDCRIRRGQTCSFACFPVFGDARVCWSYLPKTLATDRAL